MTLSRRMAALAIALLLMEAGACSKGPPGGCPEGQREYQGQCRIMCLEHNDCPAGHMCHDVEVCMPGERPPVIASIDGDGSIDGTSEHTAHHFASGLVITGQHFNDVQVSLTGLGVGLPLYESLTIRPAAMPDRIEVDLPPDVEEGDYTVSVFNSIGGDNGDVYILQGEPGEDGAAGQPGPPGFCDPSDCASQLIPGSTYVTSLVAHAPNGADGMSFTINGSEQITSTISGAGVWLGVIQRSNHQLSSNVFQHNMFYPQAQLSQFVNALDQLAQPQFSDYAVFIVSNGDVSGMMNNSEFVLVMSEIMIRLGASDVIRYVEPSDAFVFAGYANIGRGNAVTLISSSGLAEATMLMVDGRLIGPRISRTVGIAPIGAIMAWHKSLTGTPALPSGWVECNGGTVTDTVSPLYGQPIPDLNGGGRFLRGGPNSGIVEDDVFRSHTHGDGTLTTSSSGSHQHDAACACSFVSFDENDPTHWMVVGGACNYHPSNAVVASNGAHTHSISGNVEYAGGAETRPINMSVVWIMRIK